MFYCRRLMLANYLIKNGATIVEIKRNPNGNRFLCFVFKQDEALTRCLETYRVKKEQLLSEDITTSED